MKPNKRIIGITGTIAAGKSTAAAYFRDQYGIPVIDADAVGHEVLQDPTVMEKLIRAFGSNVVRQGQIDRKLLGDIVFQDPQKLEQLNHITHPVITERIQNQVNDFLAGSKEAPYLLIEAYGLYQSDLIHMVSEVWAVCADKGLRIQRVMQRQGLTREEATIRVNSQWSDEEYEKRADILLDGGHDTADLYQQCDRIQKGEWQAHHKGSL